MNAMHGKNLAFQWSGGLEAPEPERQDTLVPLRSLLITPG